MPEWYDVRTDTKTVTRRDDRRSNGSSPRALDAGPRHGIHWSINRDGRAAVADEHGFTYKKAGVDVEAGNRAVDLMKQRLTSTKSPLVIGGLGGFGGAIGLPPLKDPVLVAGTDGVGTKIEIARAMGRLDTVGIDLVAMSVNDVSACGAVPLFFLDYLVTGKVVPEEVAAIVAGVDEGCRRAQCVLLGGETAEHPGQFPGGDFDMAGFAVGVAERDELWSPGKVKEGDVLLGIDSTGVHSNGFSLIRHLLKEHAIDLSSNFIGEGGGVGLCITPGEGFGPCYDPRSSVGDVLLTPTAIYSPLLRALGQAGGVHAAAHITGGGFPDNVGRAVPADLAAVIDLETWWPSPLFGWLHGLGVERAELLRTFNCGLGLVVVVDPAYAEQAIAFAEEAEFGTRVVGEVVRRGDGDAVRYSGELRV
jgi:phosphoribosylaminoimidazole (AIR) synthetase